MVDEEKLNISIRKFLKGVGINSQRIIEKKIRDILASSESQDLSNAQITMHLKSSKLEIDEKIEGEIEIDNSK